MMLKDINFRWRRCQKINILKIAKLEDKDFRIRADKEIKRYSKTKIIERKDIRKC